MPAWFLAGHRMPSPGASRNGQKAPTLPPNGAGRTKLTNAYFDTRLATISTGRNWRTVTTLRSLMA